MLKKINKFNKLYLIKVYLLINLLFLSYSCTTTSYIPQYSTEKNLESEYIYTLSNDGQYHYVERDLGKKISVNKDILVFSTPWHPQQMEEGVYLKIDEDDPFTKALSQANETFFKKKKNVAFLYDETESSFLNPQILYSKKENGKNTTVRLADINFKWDIKLVTKEDDKVENFGKKAICLEIDKEGCLFQYFFFVYKNMKREKAEKIVRKNYPKFLNKYTPEDCTIKSLYREGSEIDSLGISLKE